MSDDLVPFDFSRKLSGLQRSLYAYILTLLPNRTDAEDVLQDTNLILCRKASEYDPKGHFQGWAFQIARYQVMAHITKSKRSRLQFSNEIIEALAAEELDTKRIALNQKALQLCYDLL
ncbi:MAG: sigma factor, partial [Opitutae bacterium]